MLDELILAACPTEEIESEIVESEKLTDKITQLRAKIGCVLPSVRMGECAKKAGGETLSCELTETSEPIGQIIKTGAPDERDSKCDSPPSVAVPHTEQSGTTCVVKPKLPKLMLPRFNGDNTKFPSFWDSFESAVDNNPGLSVIDKFNYLNSLLEGAAAQSIQGLPLSEKSYEAA